MGRLLMDPDAGSEKNIVVVMARWPNDDEGVDAIGLEGCASALADAEGVEVALVRHATPIERDEITRAEARGFDQRAKWRVTLTNEIDTFPRTYDTEQELLNFFQRLANGPESPVVSLTVERV